MNLYAEFKTLIPATPLQYARVLSVGAHDCRVRFIGGGEALVRGQAQQNATVWVRDGAIEGSAPDMPAHVIEI
ncbi:hypothetical protein FACS1894185_3390 [Betaproteobacteria bacterium]|nr:hypothetical protein FACS1894185_3390 [Betaproteobacteria bacterium]